VVIDVTNPSNPVEIAEVPSVSGDLRIVRTYDHYAYATNQNGPMQIIDLSDPENIRTVATYESEAVQGAHTIQIFGHYAYLSLWGVGTEDFRILDLSDPLAPVEVGYYRHPAQPPLAESPLNLPDNVACGDHDCSKGCMNIPHPTVTARQAVSFQSVSPDSAPRTTLGPFAIMAHDCYVRGDTAYVAFGGGGFVVLDLSDPSDPQEISVIEYDTTVPGTHTVWLNDPGTHLFVTDEYPGGHLHTWDVQDLSNITRVGEWESHPDRIIHNIYVEGDLAFLAYYTDGLRVIDITDPAEPIEVAYYDQHQGPPGSYYEGTFAAYPWTQSGAVLMSDMKNGLHLVDVDRSVRGGWVEGEVTSYPFLDPFANAVLEFTEIRKTVETDSEGRFRVGLPEGVHTLKISYYGYRSVTTMVTVVAGQTIYVDRSLAPLRFGPLQLFVRGGNNGTPLERAAVSIPELPGGIRYADENGVVDWGWVPEGTYTATIACWGYQPNQQELVVSTDKRHTAFQKRVSLDGGFFDNGDYDQGWMLGATGDDATAGIWMRGDPNPAWSWLEGSVSPDWDADITPYGLAYQTGYQNPDMVQYLYDVDGGKTTLTSPRFDLRGFPDPQLGYYRWFSNDTYTNPGEDPFLVEISNDDGETWVVLEEVWLSAREWVGKSYILRDYLVPTDMMRLRFIAQDNGGDSVVEAAVDRLSLTGTVIDVPEVLEAGTFSLSPPSPNPAPGGNAVIRFFLPAPVKQCRVEIVDVRGRRVGVLSEGPRNAGPQSLDLAGGRTTGAGLRPGLYWIRLLADEQTAITKLVVVQ
jgi:hypothetical protein